MQDWKTIDTAPKDGTAILITATIYPLVYYTPTVAKWNEDEWIVASIKDRRIAPTESPTHWMPLPEPPGIQAPFKNKTLGYCSRCGSLC